jgi:hypothetical protein
MRTDGWVFDSGCYDRSVSYRRSAQDQVTGPSTGATTMRKRASAHSGIVFSKSGASFVATVADDTNPKPKRRIFRVSEDGHAQAVAWMKSLGLDEVGQPMTANEAVTSEGISTADVVGVQAPESGVEEPVQHGDAAQPEHCNSLAEHSVGSVDPRLAVSTSAESIGNTCSPHAAHAEDGVVVCASDGADDNAVCLDSLAEAIACRSRFVASLGAYWGFADWIVWGFVEQSRVLMKCAENTIDLFDVFCEDPVRHRAWFCLIFHRMCLCICGLQAVMDVRVWSCRKLTEILSTVHICNCTTCA